MGFRFESFYIFLIFCLGFAYSRSAQDLAPQTFSLPMIRSPNTGQDAAVPLSKRYVKRAGGLPDEESFFHDIVHYYCWSPITVGGQQLAVVLDTGSTELYEILSAIGRYLLMLFIAGSTPHRQTLRH